MNRKLKIVLLVLVGLFASCGVGAGVVFGLTRGMTQTADEFFLAVKQHDLGQARGLLSEEFRAGTSEEDLAAFLARSALDQYKEAGWSSRSINNGKGTLEGAVTTETGGTVPLTLSFVKENGKWRIYSLRRSPAGLDTRASPEMPSRAEAAELVKRAFRRYGAAVRAKDMSGFHAAVARAWQNQVTVAEMNQAFAAAIANGNDYSGLDALTPRLDRDPTLSEHGVLLVEGTYPDVSPPLGFWMKFLYEGLSWKLVGFAYGLNTARPPTDGNWAGGKPL